MKLISSQFGWAHSVLLALILSASAHAASYTFNLGGNGGNGSIGSTLNFNSADLSVSVKAYAWNGSGFINAAVGQWSPGLGVINGRSDNSHAVDNQGYIDFLVFQFSQSIDVNRLYLGWVSGDSDFRYWVNDTGLPGSPTTGGINVGGGSLPAWYNINPTDTFGSYFVISARPTGTANDAFKVKTLKVDTRDVPRVPDGGTTALLTALGLTALAAFRKRSRA
jgi:hypothetical protein